MSCSLCNLILFALYYLSGIVQAIIHGDPVQNPYLFPYLVQIRRKRGKFMHAGVLIRDRIVLTIANQLIPYENRTKAKELEVIASYLTTKGYPERPNSRLDVEAIVIHESFFYQFSSPEYDIAMMKLKNSFTMNRYINTIVLTQMFPIYRWRCSISGWGSTNKTHPHVAQTLLHTGTIMMRDPINCHVQSRGILCAADDIGGTSTCWGDEGGPVVCPDGHLHGLIWGCHRPCDNEPETFINIFHHSVWINFKVMDIERDLI